jgi:hypothetical protein
LFYGTVLNKGNYLSNLILSDGEDLLLIYLLSGDFILLVLAEGNVGELFYGRTNVADSRSLVWIL